MQFKQHASVVAEACRFHAKTVVGSMESMSDTITSFTGATPASWPFVTIPDFERRARGARVESYLEMIAFSPLVTYEDRRRWSIFAAYERELLVSANQTDAPEEFIYKADMEQYELGNSSIVEDDNILTVPIWMVSPTPADASLINYNIISDRAYKYLFNAMTESKHTALSAVYDNPLLYDKLLGPNRHGDHGNTLVEENEDIPHSLLMTPVYDNFDLQNRSLTGVILGSLPWDSYLTELLPPGINGIIAVLKNTCGQAYSFQVNGPTAIFLGKGDLHDPKYQSMAEEVDFGSHFLGETTRTYRSCFYSLRIYPSQEFEDPYKSNDTKTFTGLLAIVFACLALFFFIFVWFVQRRQNKVMTIAKRTTAIISNLFPENVRERIMKQAEEQANREMDGNAGGAEANSKLQRLLNDGSNSSNNALTASQRLKSQAASSGVTVLKEAPIADLYPHCTVFFAE